MNRQITLLIIVLAGVIAACGADSVATTSGNDGGLDVIVEPSGDGTFGGELMVTPCGNTPLPLSAFGEVRPLSGSARPEIEAAIAPFLESGEGEFWPQEWLILHETDSLVTLVSVARMDADGGQLPEPNVSFMAAELRDGEWSWAGSSSGGSCELQTALPDGLGEVEWRIDPDATPLTPDSTSIVVLANERACASAQPMGERLLGPQLVLTETKVLVSFAVKPRAGDQNCPGNPDQRVVIELGEPLGDRDVVDGLEQLGTVEDLIDPPTLSE